MYAHLNNQSFFEKIEGKNIKILKEGKMIFFTGSDQELITNKKKAFEINSFYYACDNLSLLEFLQNSEISYMDRINFIVKLKKEDPQSFDLFSSLPYKFHTLFYNFYKENRDNFLFYFDTFKEVFFTHLEGSIYEQKNNIIDHYFELIFNNENNNQKFEDLNLFKENLIYFQQYFYKYFCKNFHSFNQDNLIFIIDYFEKNPINFIMNDSFFTFKNLQILVNLNDDLIQKIIELFLDKISLNKNFLEREFETDKIKIITENRKFSFFIKKYKYFFAKSLTYPLLFEDDFYNYSMDENLFLIQEQLIININSIKKELIFLGLLFVNSFSDNLLSILTNVQHVEIKSQAEHELIRRRFVNF